MPRFPALFVSLAVPMVAAATVPVFILGAQHERTLATALDRAAQSTISASSEQKAKRLDALGRERVRMARALAAEPAVRAILAGERESGSAATARLDEAMAALGVSRVALLDATGESVFEREAPRGVSDSLEEAEPKPASPADLEARTRARMAALRLLRRGNATVITHPDRAAAGAEAESERGERPAPEAIAPIRDGGAVVGHAVVAIDLPLIDEIVGDATGLGSTGETMCAVVLGSEVVVTTPTRANPDAAYTLRWALGERRLPKLDDVLIGNSARGEDKDLEGRAVLGAWTRIESIGWSIAVTQEREEIAAPLAAVRQRTTFVGAIAAAGALVAAGIAAQLLARAFARRGQAERTS